MNIFDLDISEFEIAIEKMLDNISQEDLLEELIKNGLAIDEYDNEYYYVEEELNNVWVHRTTADSKKERIKNFFGKKDKTNLLEAA